MTALAALYLVAPSIDDTHDPLHLIPCTVTRAKEYVRDFHRHLDAPAGGLFAVGVGHGDDLSGVAIAGRPVARMLDDGWTIEITRVATDGSRNACSMLYGAAWRAARALGYERGVTYTLPSESGASLRGAGWTPVTVSPGGGWSRSSRPRADAFPTCPKIRWQVDTSDARNHNRIA